MDCPSVITVVGTNVVGVSLSLINATNPSINFLGDVMTNCSIYISESRIGAAGISVTASAVANVSVVLVNTTSPPDQNAYLMMIMVTNLQQLSIKILRCVFLSPLVQLSTYFSNPSLFLDSWALSIADSFISNTQANIFISFLALNIFTFHGVAIDITRSNITAPNAQFMMVGISSSTQNGKISNFSFIVESSSFVKLAGPVVYLYSNNVNPLAPCIVSNVTMRFANSYCGGPAFFALLSMSSNITDTDISFVKTRVSVGVYQNTSRPPVLLQYMNSVGRLTVVFDNTVVVLTFAALGMSNIVSIDGPLTLTTQRNSTMYSDGGSFAGLGLLAGMFYFMIQMVDFVRGPLVLTIDGSALFISASSLILCPVALILLNNFTVSSAGSFQLTISNSSLLVQQTQFGSADLCGILSATGVSLETTSPDVFVLSILNKSSVTISCWWMSCIVNCMQTTRFSFSFLAAGGSKLAVKSNSWVQRSSLSTLIVGSFVFLIINSTVSNSVMVIRDCTLTVGIIFQLAGVYGNAGLVYISLLLPSIGANYPTIVDHASTNATISITNTTLTNTAPPSSILRYFEPRSLFTFVGMKQMAVNLQGPLILWTGGAPTLVDVTGVTKAAGNMISLSGCRDIHAIKSSDMTLLPLEQSIRDVSDVVNVTWDSTCALTGTSTRDHTESASITRCSSTSSPTASHIFLRPDVQKNVRVSAARAAMSGAVSVVVLISGPVVATSVQTLRAQSLISNCPDGADSSAGDGPPPDFSNSPTQMAVSPVSGAYDRGTVVGNTLVLASAAALAAAAFALPTGRTAADLALPGLLFVPYSILVVPTVTSSVTLLAGPDQAQGDAVIALLLGLGLCGIGPLVLLGVKTNRRFFLARPVRVSLRRIKGHPVRKLLVGLYEGMTAYDSFPEARGFVERWDYSGITAYTPYRQWFRVVELSLGVATGVLAGLTSGASVTMCQVLNLLQTVFSFLLLALIMLLRPYSCRIDKWAAIASCLMQCVTAVFGLLGTDMSYACSVAQLIMSLAVAIGYFTWQGLDGCTRLVKLLKPTEWHHHRDESGRPPQPDRLRLASLTDDDLMKLKELGRDAGESRGDSLKLLVEVICR